MPGSCGATLAASGVVFSVWAPQASTIIVEAGPAGAVPERRALVNDGGWWSAAWAGAAAGWRYRFVVDGNGPFPDPYSRSQPDGVHGASEVIDQAFEWTDHDWAGIDRLVVYEIHVGAASGTFDGVIAMLPRLKDLGVTAIELMPVAAFPGDRGWGYDGVSAYAPHPGYGGPAGLKRLVDAAHREGLGVILDAVYNHLGPSGNYLGVYSPTYVTDRYQTPWGDALNYDGPDSAPTRRWAIDNAVQWVRDYHIDGLRLDAIHAIHDNSPRHILAELTDAVRAVGRPVILIAEDDRNDARVITPTAQGGLGFDAVWADDFHHAVHTALTGERDGYYASFSGELAEIGRAIRDGWLRGGAAPADRPARQFVFCLQNHDQVGNRALGDRLPALVGRDRYLAMLAVLLLAPETPLLFMGDEWATETPFLFFTDHDDELGPLVTEGRRREFAGFAAFSDPAARERIPDPQDRATFDRSRLPEPDAAARQAEALVGDLLHLRRTDPLFSDTTRQEIDTSTHGDVLTIRWRNADYLLVVNLGDEPVAAPFAPTHTTLAPLLVTSDRRYGGSGDSAGVAAGAIRVPARSAALFAAAPVAPAD